MPPQPQTMKRKRSTRILILKPPEDLEVSVAENGESVQTSDESYKMQIVKFKSLKKTFNSNYFVSYTRVYYLFNREICDRFDCLLISTCLIEKKLPLQSF